MLVEFLHRRKGLNLFIEPGMGLEEFHNFFVSRPGTIDDFEIPGNWDFSSEIVFDLKDHSIGALIREIRQENDFKMKNEL